VRIFLVCFLFLKQVSLYSPGWAQIHDSADSTSWVLGFRHVLLFPALKFMSCSNLCQHHVTRATVSKSLFPFSLLGHWTLHMLGKHSTSELHPQPKESVIFYCCLFSVFHRTQSLTHARQVFYYGPTPPIPNGSFCPTSARATDHLSYFLFWNRKCLGKFTWYSGSCHSCTQWRDAEIQWMTVLGAYDHFSLCNGYCVKFLTFSQWGTEFFLKKIPVTGS
jgi:hypothetical protein